MTSILTELLICALVTVSVVVCQVNYVCPREDGTFEYTTDCTKFYQCDKGRSSLMNCPSQLVFNPQTSQCDYSHNVQNTNCRAQAVNTVKGPYAQLCSTLPSGVPANEAFIVGHPELCNAYVTCSLYYLHSAQCQFCPEDMYFSKDAGGCRDIKITGRSRDELCQNKPFVEHRDKTKRQQDGTCWPYLSPNPYEVTATPRSG